MQALQAGAYLHVQIELKQVNIRKVTHSGAQLNELNCEEIMEAS